MLLTYVYLDNKSEFSVATGGTAVSDVYLERA
jgi:hypothetical protein